MQILVLLSGLLAASLGVRCASPSGRRYLTRNFRRGRLLGWLAVAATLIIVLGSIVCLLDPSDHEALHVAVVAATVVLCAVMLHTFRSFHIRTKSAPEPRKFLIVGAHPDDLELACGGTLAKLADAGHELHGLIMTNGSQGGDAERRIGEAERGAGFLQLTSLKIADLPDLNLESHSNEMVKLIEERAGEVEPDVIFTHSRNDYHQDHLAVHLAVMRASRKHNSILCFESPSVTSDFNPTVFVDVEEYRDVKMEAINAHRDQLGKSYLNSQVVNGIGAFRGRQARLNQAEGFEVVRFTIPEGFAL